MTLPTAPKWILAWILAWVLACLNGLGLPQVGRAQQPQDPAVALRAMFEQLGKQSSQFMPGMFSELSDQQMAELEKVGIAPREEVNFGNQVLKNYEATLRSQNQMLTRQGSDVKYLSALTDTLRPYMSNARRYPKIDVAVVETDSIDAYSIPGGHLIFTTGLLKNAESEAELVGVIAHELSHLDRGHQLLALKQLKTIGKVSDVRAGMLWISTMAKPFRPEFESQADADAVKWMLAAGYDPRQLAKLLNRWAANEAQNPNWTRMIPSFARSHPESGRRALTVLNSSDASGVDLDRLIIGRENLAKREPSQVGQHKP